MLTDALTSHLSQLEQLIDKRSKDRLTVQRTMEELKKNTKSTKDNIRKTFRELRTLLNDVEAAINHETESVSQNKMNQLQNQCRFIKLLKDFILFAKIYIFLFLPLTECSFLFVSKNDFLQSSSLLVLILLFLLLSFFVLKLLLFLLIDRSLLLIITFFFFLSSMIESTNKAKTLSCLCQRASDMDYFESLVEKKKLERDVVRTIEEELVGYYGPCESSDLFIQFPNREGVTSAILNLPYIVRGMYWVFLAIKISLFFYWL